MLKNIELPLLGPTSDRIEPPVPIWSAPKSVLGTVVEPPAFMTATVQSMTSPTRTKMLEYTRLTQVSVL